MFKVLIITFTGIGIGYLVRKAAWIGRLPKSITYTIWLLLFFFGLQVGANELVITNLDTLGLKALIIALAGSLGSCVAARAVERIFFRDGAIFKGKGEVEESGAMQGKFAGMMGGAIVVAFFALGCICGWLDFLPDILQDGSFSMYVLYALMIQVGISIGSDKQLKEILMGLNPKLLFLPLGTIIGTLIFVAAVTPAITGFKFPDTLAVGAGFGYYSLSSLLITEIKGVSSGAVFAAQLGTMALMSNIMREVITLLLAPFIRKVFGKLAPISVGGATSMDSTLPVISAVCGKDMVFISIFHGVLVDFSVPFLVTFFASL